MHFRWRTLLFGVAIVAAMAPMSFGQSLLEQLEKKVRDGLELSAPQGEPDKPAEDQAKSTPAKPATRSEAELPAPNRNKTAPPPPTASPAAPGGSSTNSGPSTAGTNRPAASPGRTSSSILEAPREATATRSATEPAVDTQESSSEIYLGLEAESLVGGGIGARVVNVTESSPAWRAGFRVNDVILAIDGFAIASLDTMVERLALRQPGDTIKVLLLRSGRNMELTAVLQNADIARRAQGLSDPAMATSENVPGQAWMGAVVADLSNAFRNQFGLKVYRAAAVTNVTRGSPADLVNIQPGDAIIAVDQKSIQSARDLLEWMLAKRPGDRVNLTVMRGSRTATIELTLGTDPKALPLPTPRRAPDVFAARSPVTDDANPAVDEAGVDIVPSPTNDDSQTTMVQLREELRAARQQLTALEQRIAELESQFNRQPQ